MFVRFQIAVLLVALVAIGTSALEHAILDARRSIGRQQYQTEELLERIAQARLTAERSMALALLDRPQRDQDRVISSEGDAGSLKTVARPASPRRSIVGEE